MTFTSYEKIAETTAKWGLDEKAYRQLRRASWVVTEKIHGANFSFVVDGETLHCANRRHLLEEDEEFFGWQQVRDRLAPAVREVAKQLPGERITIYGELFGGTYPHPEVPAVPGAQPVQTGVWYAPDVQLCAFDIAMGSESKRRYLDYERTVALCTNAGLLVAEPLFIGGYEAAQEYPVRFDSTLPRRLGLPALPPGTNIAEGVVVKPYREIAGVSVRPIIKRKIPEFAEDRRFHEAEKSVSAPVDNTALEMLKWEAYCRVTENRLQSAVSKVGTTNREAVLRLFQEDITDELRAEHAALLASLTPAQQTDLTAFIAAETKALAETAL
jgi:Rnl2 family RNA ligase